MMYHLVCICVCVCVLCVSVCVCVWCVCVCVRADLSPTFMNFLGDCHDYA